MIGRRITAIFLAALSVLASACDSSDLDQPPYSISASQNTALMPLPTESSPLLTSTEVEAAVRGFLLAAVAKARETNKAADLPPLACVRGEFNFTSRLWFMPCTLGAATTLTFRVRDDTAKVDGIAEFTDENISDLLAASRPKGDAGITTPTASAVDVSTQSAARGLIVQWTQCEQTWNDGNEVELSITVGRRSGMDISYLQKQSQILRSDLERSCKAVGRNLASISQSKELCYQISTSGSNIALAGNIQDFIRSLGSHVDTFFLQFARREVDSFLTKARC
jgi:hypothetical protein